MPIPEGYLVGLNCRVKKAKQELEKDGNEFNQKLAFMGLIGYCEGLIETNEILK